MEGGMKTGVFGSVHQTGRLPLLKRMFGKLEEVGAAVSIDRDFYDFLAGKLDYRPQVAGFLDGDTFDSDLVISVGGDGTFLRTAARVGRQGIPILGINTGRLGFLADVGEGELEATLDEVFSGRYQIEDRSLLHLQTNNRLFKGYNYALNEIAVSKRDTSSMMSIHAYINDEYLATYLSDGLIIATPTGSTAYSMSVGGPILVPQSNSLVISPVAPHSLTIRPLVVPDNSLIRLTVESRSRFFLVSLDGRSEVFPTDEALTITKAAYTTKVIKRHNHTFYETLREKLMWGMDARSR